MSRVNRKTCSSVKDLDYFCPERFPAVLDQGWVQPCADPLLKNKTALAFRASCMKSGRMRILWSTKPFDGLSTPKTRSKASARATSRPRCSDINCLVFPGRGGLQPAFRQVPPYCQEPALPGESHALPLWLPPLWPSLLQTYGSPGSSSCSLPLSLSPLSLSPLLGRVKRGTLA